MGICTFPLSCTWCFVVPFLWTGGEGNASAELWLEEVEFADEDSDKSEGDFWSEEAEREQPNVETDSFRNDTEGPYISPRGALAPLPSATPVNKTV